MPVYTGTEFPVIPAFWNMLLGLAGKPSTSPDGVLINLVGLRDIVQKVKNGEMLPKKGKAV